MAPSKGKYFVVVSGLPGSGKSTLAQHLASALNLPLLDKDTILERLFDSKGMGDLEWRRTLSRESDQIFQAEAIALDGAVLVSHWRLSGMPLDSGTPTTWLRELSGKVVHVYCKCEPEVAAARFVERTRHPGHLDREKRRGEILAGIREIARLDPLDIGPRVELDTSRPPRLADVLRGIRRVLR